MGKIYENFYSLLDELKYINAKHNTENTYYIDNYITVLELFKGFIKLLPSYVSFIILDINRNIKEINSYKEIEHNNIYRIINLENENNRLKYSNDILINNFITEDKIELIDLYNKNIDNRYSILDKNKMMLHVPIIWSLRKIKYTYEYLNNIFINNIDCKKCASIAYDNSLKNCHNKFLYNFIHSFFIFAPSREIILNKISKNTDEQVRILNDMNLLLNELEIFLNNFYNFILDNRIILNKFCVV